MSTGVVSKSLGSTVETNNLNTCTSAKREAHANAAGPIKGISVAEFEVPEAGVASTGGAKDSVSFRGWNKMLPVIIILKKIYNFCYRKSAKTRTLMQPCRIRLIFQTS